MSRRVRWSLTGLFVIALGVVVAHQLHLFAGSESTPVPLAEVEQRYNALTSTTIADPDPETETDPDPDPGTDTDGPTTTTANELAVPGVYMYATTGRDSVDALTGAHHDYPATTTITVIPTACGIQQRWDVLEERWEEWQRCIDSDGVSEPGRTNYDEFFGQSQTDTWVCTGAPRPLAAAAGTTWSKTCVNGSAIDTYDGVVIGTEPQVVGTTTVDTLHVRVTITDDVSPDLQVIDTWYLAGTDLVVVQTSTAATTNDSPVGTVNYDETYGIRLSSLTPLG